MVIELSEHKAESNFDSSTLIEQLERLRAQGFQVALDDFGVEHSNMDRLTNLPLDIVKLDRSLIEKHRDSTRTNFVIRSIVLLCRSLKLKIIAEGIETENDVRRLRACNVESQQGFWHARWTQLTCRPLKMEVALSGIRPWFSPTRQALHTRPIPDRFGQAL